MSTSAKPAISAASVAALRERFEFEIQNGPSHQVYGNYQRSKAKAALLDPDNPVLPFLIEYLAALRDTQGSAASELKEAWIMLFREMADYCQSKTVPHRFEFSWWVMWARGEVESHQG